MGRNDRAALNWLAALTRISRKKGRRRENITERPHSHFDLTAFDCDDPSVNIEQIYECDWTPTTDEVQQQPQLQPPQQRTQATSGGPMDKTLDAQAEEEVIDEFLAYLVVQAPETLAQPEKAKGEAVACEKYVQELKPAAATADPDQATDDQRGQVEELETVHAVLHGAHSETKPYSESALRAFMDYKQTHVKHAYLKYREILLRNTAGSAKVLQTECFWAWAREAKDNTSKAVHVSFGDAEIMTFEVNDDMSKEYAELENERFAAILPLRQWRLVVGHPNLRASCCESVELYGQKRIYAVDQLDDDYRRELKDEQQQQQPRQQQQASKHRDKAKSRKQPKNSLSRKCPGPR